MNNCMPFDHPDRILGDRSTVITNANQYLLAKKCQEYNALTEEQKKGEAGIGLYNQMKHLNEFILKSTK